MDEPPPRPVPAREGYELWAPTYGAENPLTFFDELAVRELSPPIVGKALLDGGCGTGRRLPDIGPHAARLAVGIDLVPAMLERGRRAGKRLLACADLRSLPFGHRLFDIVWCRLVIGHLAELALAYAELARVLRPGGCVVVTDFHPVAARAGYVRSFRDSAGTIHTLEHHVHDPADHDRAAGQAGLPPAIRVELRVNPAVRDFYASAGMLDRYAQQIDMPLLLGLRFGG